MIATFVLLIMTITAIATVIIVSSTAITSISFAVVVLAVAPSLIIEEVTAVFLVIIAARKVTAVTT